jgi:hypothetical protein
MQVHFPIDEYSRLLLAAISHLRLSRVDVAQRHVAVAQTAYNHHVSVLVNYCLHNCQFSSGQRREEVAVGLSNIPLLRLFGMVFHRRVIDHFKYSTYISCSHRLK